MADYFTHFSEVLTLNSKEDLRRAIEIYQAFEAQGIGDEAKPPEFCVSVLPGLQEPSLHISDTGGFGNPEHVMLYVEAVAAACGLKGRWGCTWAYTCSKARIGAYAGGACVIDFDTAKRHEIDCGDWAERIIRGEDLG